MPRYSRRIHIFKAGEFIDASGKKCSFSADDIRRMATAYDPERKRAPLVLGHPADNKPSFGDVYNLVGKDGNLHAFAFAEDSLIDSVRRGYYRNVSASFYMPNHPGNPSPGAYYLRHVGFLGGHPPAVKGLEPLHFADTAPGILSFSAGINPADGFPLDFSEPCGRPGGDRRDEMAESNRLAYQFILSR